MLTAARKAQARFAPEPLRPWPGSLSRQYADLDCGRVGYLRHGEGPPLLLVHGIPTSARLWEGLLDHLGQRFDCIAPDLLGLGASVPGHGADLASPGQADMLAQLLDHLGIDICAAVFHDQGGAHGQQMIMRHGHRLAATVFTDCVALDNWPVPLIDGMARVEPALPLLAKLRLLQWGTRLLAWPQTVHRRPTIPDPLLTEWLAPLDVGGERLTRWIAYLGAQSNRWTLEAESALEVWRKPTLILWGGADKFLPPSWAGVLADLIPGTRATEIIPFAGHFWQTEAAATGARTIRRFLEDITEPQASRPTGASP